MGQKANSDVFLEYLSKTSITDVQSIARGLAPHDMRIFSSIRLCRPETPLTRSSLRAAEKLRNDARHIELRHELSAANERWLVYVNTIGSREIAMKSLLNEYKAKRAAEKAAHSYASRFMEFEYRQEYEAAHKEAVTARPTLSATMKTESPETRGMDEDMLQVPAAIKDRDRLTLEQAGDLIDNLESLGDLGDGEEGSPVELKIEMLDTALDAIKNKSCRLHQIYREGLSEMVGAAGRALTLLASFSSMTILLKYLYEALTQDQTITSEEVARGILELDGAEIFRHTLPSHWRSETAGFCIVCNEALDAKNAYEHTWEC